MGRVRVKYNHLPAVIRALPRELEQGMNEAALDLGNDLEPVLWEDTGVVISTVDPEVQGLHATVGVGQVGGRGFYVRFLELGTSNPNKYGIVFSPDPRVTRTGQAFEPAFASHIGDAAKRACRAR